MSNTDIVQFGFSVDTSPLNAADAALAQLEKRAASAGAALNRMSANITTAFAKVPAGMGGMAGPSPVGGSTASAGAAAHTAAEAAAEAAAALKAARDLSVMGKAADALRAQLDPLAAAHLRMSDAVGKYEQMSKLGLISQTEFTGGVHLAGEAFKTAEEEIRKHTSGLGLNRNQMMELQHVGRALFDEVSAGGNVFRALLMESGRLGEVLGEGKGGLGGALNVVKNGFSMLASPAVLAAAAIGTVTAVSVAAALSYEDSQARLQRAVEGTGRASGMTANQLRAIADTGAASANMGVGEARTISSGFAQAGLPADMTASLLNATPRFARFTDQDNASAGAALAGDFRDPVAGAKKLDESLGFLNARLLQTIEDMKASGDLEGARQVELQAFNAALKQTTDNTWAIGDAFRELKRWSGSLFEGVGQGINHVLGGDASPQDQIKYLREQVLPHTFDSPYALGNLNQQNVLDKINRLQQQIDTKVDPEAAARGARANELSLQAAPIIKSLLPEMMKAQTTADNLNLLRTVLSDPATMSVLPMARSSVVQAYGRETVMAANADPDRRARQDYDIRIASVGEMDVENKGLLDARRAEIQLLRETGDVLRAARTAQMSLNETIAAANAEAEDKATKSHESLGLVGLSPYDRAMQEIRNRYDGPDGLIERNRFDRGANNVLNDEDIKGDLQGASKKVAAALDDLPSRIQSGGEKIAAAMDAAATRIASGAAGVPSPFGTLDRHAFDHPGAPVPFFAGGAFSRAPVAIQAQATAASAQTGIPASIIAAIGERENGFKLTGYTNILGPDGRPATSAYGYGQLTNGAAADVARALPGFNKFDPSTAVLGSAEYLKILKGRFGDMQTALDHYGTGSSYGADIMRRAGGGIPIPTGPAPVTVTASSSVAPIASTSAASYTAARADDVAALNKQFGQVPVDQANKALTSQIALLDTQRDTFGQSTAAVKGAAEAQTLWNKLVSDGVAPAGELSKQTGALADKVRAYGSEATKVAQQQQDQQREQQSIIGFADTTRGGIGDVLGGGFLSAAQGKGFGAGAKSASQRFGEGLISKGTNSIIGSLLGGQGAPFGGLFGNLLSGIGLPHFAGGTSDAPGGPTVVGESGPELVEMPKHAQVMTAGQTSGLMASRIAPQVNVGGHSIVVQGNADAKTLDAMDAKIAAANEQQYQRIVRDLPQIQNDNAQTS